MKGSLKYHLCRAYNMTPYLGEIGKLVDFPDTYQRKYLHETVRNQTARRSGIFLHFEKYTVYFAFLHIL
jgi:hypothetical protein